MELKNWFQKIGELKKFFVNILGEKAIVNGETELSLVFR